jgi:hypothetical protein
MADSKDSKAAASAESPAPTNPHASQDPNIPDGPEADLDPTKVVGTYAMQPDPNDDRPAPQPNIPKGVREAPADDEPGAGAIGEGKQ